jgi:hypothetical protein
VFSRRQGILKHVDEALRKAEQAAADGNPGRLVELKRALARAGQFRPELYLNDAVREYLEGEFYLSAYMHDSGEGCGALVRMVGNAEIRGSWRCPVCGIARPYVFWSIKSHDSADKPRSSAN